MKQEASLEQWKVLYEVATRIKELKPWEKFWDMDLNGICNGNEEDTVFYSILKMIAMADIEVSDKFKLPSKEKIDAVIQYYKEHGKIDKPVSVSCHGKKYKLEDKYLRYYVAKQLGLKEIPARISTKKENKLEDKIRVVGTKVKHTKYGIGKITRVTDNSVDIIFESGKESTFNVEMCVKSKLISLA